jgi:hypothetical protein
LLCSSFCRDSSGSSARQTPLLRGWYSGKSRPLIGHERFSQVDCSVAEAPRNDLVDALSLIQPDNHLPPNIANGAQQSCTVKYLSFIVG